MQGTATLRTTFSALAKYNGQAVEVIGPVDPDQYDPEEVGPMFEVEASDGERLHVFADEIRATR